jgi:acyl-coenzyme A thioesterase PaaI-like protein
MDVTALARSLLGPVPAHGTAGLEVLRAAGGAAEVALLTQPALTSVIGSLHSSGLITLADVAGLAAIIAACEAEDEIRGVLPLGAAATLEFRAPRPRPAGRLLPPRRDGAGGAAAGADRSAEARPDQHRGRDHRRGAHARVPGHIRVERPPLLALTR